MDLAVARLTVFPPQHRLAGRLAWAVDGELVPVVAGAGLHDYGENYVLDAHLGSGTPAIWYLGLLTATPTDADTGSTVVEPTSSQWQGYARVALTNNATNWPAAVAGSKANGAPFTFPEAGGASTGCTVTRWALFTAASGGNCFCDFALTNSRAIVAGVAPQFAAGTLVVTLD